MNSNLEYMNCVLLRGHRGGRKSTLSHTGFYMKYGICRMTDAMLERFSETRGIVRLCLENCG